MVFEDGDGGIELMPEELLPTDRVIEAVVSFYREQRRPDSVPWRTIAGSEEPEAGSP
jgi:hypothetical protein